MSKIELHLRQRKVQIKRHTLQRNRWLRRQLRRGPLRGLSMRGALSLECRVRAALAYLAGWFNGLVVR